MLEYAASHKAPSERPCTEADHARLRADPARFLHETIECGLQAAGPDEADGFLYLGTCRCGSTLAIEVSDSVARELGV